MSHIWSYLYNGKAMSSILILFQFLLLKYILAMYFWNPCWHKSDAPLQLYIEFDGTSQNLQNGYFLYLSRGLSALQLCISCFFPISITKSFTILQCAALIGNFFILRGPVSEKKVFHCYFHKHWIVGQLTPYITATFEWVSKTLKRGLNSG